jgi:hypothetical protein
MPVRKTTFDPGLTAFSTRLPGVLPYAFPLAFVFGCDLIRYERKSLKLKWRSNGCLNGASGAGQNGWGSGSWVRFSTSQLLAVALTAVASRAMLPDAGTPFFFVK